MRKLMRLSYNLHMHDRDKHNEALLVDLRNQAAFR